jgi:mono/diheme cytochrome c family protein
MYALDGRNGKLLWQFESGVSCDTKPVIADNMIYWVSGAKLYAFTTSAPVPQAAVATSPAGPSVHDGVYISAQAARGKALYAQSCAAACHGENLSGQGPAPSLAGPDFRARWAGVSVGELFKRVHTTMPKTDPGSLSVDDDLAIVAYLLSANGFPAGANVLPNDPAALGRIAIEK